MIQIFVTGGTFDKEYNFITGELYFNETHLPAMFKRGRCDLDVAVETLMMVDSLEMTEMHRGQILSACKSCSHDQILITHGTDRMVNTAEAIAGMRLDKTIVLTGAMVPYAFGTSSDGFFNLGAALAYVQSLQPGVYISMNGRAYPWNDVRKNYTTGYFETLSS